MLEDQRRVEAFLEEAKLHTDPAYRLLDLTAEVGANCRRREGDGTGRAVSGRPRAAVTRSATSGDATGISIADSEAAVVYRDRSNRR